MNQSVLMRPPCVPLRPPSASPLDGCVPPGGRRRTRRSDGNVDPFAQVIALHLGVALCPPPRPPCFRGAEGGGGRCPKGGRRNPSLGHLGVGQGDTGMRKPPSEV